MNLSKQQILTLQAICKKGIADQKSASKWLVQLSQEEGVGQIRGKQISISYQDILKIRVFLELHGYGEEATQETFESRTEASKVFANEKLASSAVTDNRVFLKTTKHPIRLNGHLLPVGHGIEFRVNELDNLQASQIVLIENLDTFFEADRCDGLISLLNDDAVFVYRGGQGFFSAKGSQDLLNNFKGEKIGFFDFDPAGLCLLGVKGLDKVVVPDLNTVTIKELIGASREDRFFEQLPQYNSLLVNIANSQSNLSMVGNQMKVHNLAVMQETLLSRDMQLVLVDLNR